MDRLPKGYKAIPSLLLPGVGVRAGGVQGSGMVGGEAGMGGEGRGGGAGHPRGRFGLRVGMRVQNR